MFLCHQLKLLLSTLIHENATSFLGDAPVTRFPRHVTKFQNFYDLFRLILNQWATHSVFPPPIVHLARIDMHFWPTARSAGCFSVHLTKFRHFALHLCHGSRGIRRFTGRIPASLSVLFVKPIRVIRVSKREHVRAAASAVTSRNSRILGTDVQEARRAGRGMSADGKSVLRIPRAQVGR